MFINILQTQAWKGNGHRETKDGHQVTHYNCGTTNLMGILFLGWIESQLGGNCISKPTWLLLCTWPSSSPLGLLGKLSGYGQCVALKRSHWIQKENEKKDPDRGIQAMDENVLWVVHRDMSLSLRGFLKISLKFVIKCEYFEPPLFPAFSESDAQG